MGGNGNYSIGKRSGLSTDTPKISFGSKVENDALLVARDFVKTNYGSQLDQAKNFDSSKLKEGDSVEGKAIKAGIFYDNIQQHQWFVRDYDATVIKSTAKAVQLDWDTDYGHVKAWFPKSVIGSNAGIDKGMIYYSALKEYGTKLGIKGLGKNVKLKLATVKDRTTKAGYKIPNINDLNLG